MNYNDVLRDNEDVILFARNMQKFDTFFCEMVTAGTDFTIKLEVRGNKGLLEHCRVDYNEFDRPEREPQRKSRKVG